MRADVEQDPARVLGTAALAPLAPVGLGPPAIEARLQTHQVSQRALGDEPPQRQEIPVPAPVVEDARHHSACRRGIREPLRVGHVRGQRLVHHEVKADVHGSEGERHVMPVGRCDHREVVRVGGCEQVVGRRKDPHVRVGGARLG